MAKKALVVDDDPVVQRLVAAILKDNGFEVDSAMDGLDALVKIKREAPDVVVLDVVMPEINGYDVCYELRFNKNFERVPIVLLTETERELDDIIEERTNIEFVPKPVDRKLLLKKINYVLSKA